MSQRIRRGGPGDDAEYIDWTEMPAGLGVIPQNYGGYPVCRLKNPVKFKKIWC